MPSSGGLTPAETNSFARSGRQLLGKRQQVPGKRASRRTLCSRERAAGSFGRRPHQSFNPADSVGINAVLDLLGSAKFCNLVGVCFLLVPNAPYMPPNPGNQPDQQHNEFQSLEGIDRTNFGQVNGPTANASSSHQVSPVCVSSADRQISDRSASRTSRIAASSSCRVLKSSPISSTSFGILKRPKALRIFAPTQPGMKPRTPNIMMAPIN